jgi:hypothetical protein
VSQVKLSLKTVDSSFISYTIDGTFPTAFLGIRNEGFQDDYTMINIDESCILRVLKRVFRLFPISRISRKATCSKGILLLKINWILHIYKEPQDQKTLFNTIFNFNKTHHLILFLNMGQLHSILILTHQDDIYLKNFYFNKEFFYNFILIKIYI